MRNQLVLNTEKCGSVKCHAETDWIPSSHYGLLFPCSREGVVNCYQTLLVANYHFPVWIQLCWLVHWKVEGMEPRSHLLYTCLLWDTGVVGMHAHTQGPGSP